jgi:hypothetical protein
MAVAVTLSWFTSSVRCVRGRVLGCMTSTLVIFFLSVQSSYARNTEAPATEEAFDTVQFYGGEQGFWRIKTYATDQDVHVWSLGNSISDLVELARSSTEKHYRDVLTEGYIIESRDGTNGLRRELVDRGLPPNLEISDSGFLFWALEGTHYRSRSRPKQ